MALPHSASLPCSLLCSLASQLNETYKIDFGSLKQIRRDDADRWRFIKRGGTAADGPPGANGFVAADDAADDEVKDADADEEEEAPKKKGGKAAAAKPAAKGKAKAAAAAAKDEPAPAAAAWSVPATDSPFKKGAAGVAPTPREPVKKDEDTAAAMSDDEESVPNGKARSGGGAAAAAASSKPAAAAAASSASGAEEKKLRAELESMRKQMADLESELETSQSAAEAAQKKLAAEVARLNSAAAENKSAAAEIKKAQEEAESLRTKNAALTKSLATSDARATKAQSELTAAQEAARKAQAAADEVSKKLVAATKAQQSAEARASKAEAASAATASAVADLAALRTKYASVLSAIKPVAATFGLAPTTVIGAAIIEFDKNGGVFKAGAGAAAPAAAAAATPAKKRGRDDEDQEEEDEENAATQEIVSTAKKARPTPAAAPTSAASARASDDERHSDAPSDDEGGAASPRAAASRNIDDDATQPMVAPNSDDEGMTDVKGAGAGAGAGAAAGKFLHNPNALDSALISKVGDKAVPLCVAAVPLTSASGPHLVIVGGRNGSLQLYEMAPSVPARLLPLSMVHRPPHKHAPKESPPAGEDGEQYALTSHVLAMAVVPLKPASGSYLLFAGEGRMLRVYNLTIASAAGKLALLTEFDVGASSWVTCLTRLYAPASVRQANQEHVGVGISGAAQVVQIYSIATGGASAVVKLERSLPTRSDEVRALAQLRRDGRLVVAGCSALLEGSMNEGGSIELHAWDGAAKSRQSVAITCTRARAWLIMELHRRSLFSHRFLSSSVCVLQVLGPRFAGSSYDRSALQLGRRSERHWSWRCRSAVGRLRVLQQWCSSARALHLRYRCTRSRCQRGQRGGEEQSIARGEHVHVDCGEPEPTQSLRRDDVRRSVTATLTHDGQTEPAERVQSARCEGSLICCCPSVRAPRRSPGKLIVYELNGDKHNTKLATISAHGDSDHDDGTHCFIVSSRPDNSAPVMLTVGGINQLKQWNERK